MTDHGTCRPPARGNRLAPVRGRSGAGEGAPVGSEAVPDPSATRPRRRGRVPVVVLAATMAFGLLGAVWSVVAPLGEAPDEPAHLALVLHLADGHGYPAYDGLTNQAAIIRLCRTYASATRACPREGEPVTPTSMRLHPRSEAPDKADRPAWDDEGGDASVGQINQMPQHPPLYYQAMATVLRAERAVNGGPMSADRELALLRLVNAAMLAPLPLLAWWAARRFRLGEGAAVTASVAVFAIPMLTHIGSTLNNDNLLTLLAAVGAALLAGVLRGDRSLRTAVAVGAVAGLALLTKAFGMVLIPAIVVAYLLGTADHTHAPAPDPADPDPAGGEVGGGEEEWGWRERLRAVVGPIGAAGAAVLVLVAIGLERTVGRWAPVATAGFALLIQAEALRRCLQGWWGGPGLGPRGQLQAMVAWSAWPGELIGVLAVVALAAGAWFLVALVRFVLQAGDGRPVGSMPT